MNGVDQILVYASKESLKSKFFTNIYVRVFTCILFPIFTVQHLHILIDNFVYKEATVILQAKSLVVTELTEIIDEHM